MNLKSFFQSKLFKHIALGIAGLIVLLLIFNAGMFVGFKKAHFSCQWGKNYDQNFAGRRGGFFGDMDDKRFVDAHGVFGQILKIDGSSLIIKDRDTAEEVVLIKDNTVIRKFRDTIKISDLRINDGVVVIGEPNEKGQIEAKLIRLLPSPPPSPASNR